MAWTPQPAEIAVSDLPGDRWLVTLVGEHDLTTAPELRDKLAAIFRTGTSVVVDLAETKFVDSSILAVLLWAAEIAEQGPCEHFGLVLGGDGPAARLLTLTGATRMFTAYRTVEEAFAAFDENQPDAAAAQRWASRKKRIVKNELAFRDYNNRRMSAEPVAATDDDELIPFVCECGNQDCIETLMITAAQFTEAHSAPNRFLVRPGHVHPDVERLVSESDAYGIVEKTAPIPAR
jgi:anti-anti-sigma factor